jgi:hypothetical protein
VETCDALQIVRLCYRLWMQDSVVSKAVIPLHIVPSLDLVEDPAEDIGESGDRIDRQLVKLIGNRA